MLYKKILIIYIFIISLSCTDNISKLLNYEEKLWYEITDNFNKANDEKTKIEILETLHKTFSRSRKFDDIYMNFLTKKIELSEDAISNFVYFLISDYYWENDDIEKSYLYMVRIDEKYYNYKYNGMDIGYQILLRFIKYNNRKKLKIESLKKLLIFYPNYIDEIMILNSLAESYLENYDTKNAYETYCKLIKIIEDQKINDERINIKEIKNFISFYSSDKSWISDNLDDLILKIKNAIEIKNYNLLLTYTSKSGFIINFMNRSDENYNIQDLQIYNKWNNNIRFETKYEDISNLNEIFIETTGWDFQQLTMWYFYFKRVDYPYDYNLNGSWEWKGILF